MIIADTGFWVALLDRRDNLYQKTRACAAQIHEPLITTLAGHYRSLLSAAKPLRVETIGGISLGPTRGSIPDFHPRRIRTGSHGDPHAPILKFADGFSGCFAGHSG